MRAARTSRATADALCAQSDGTAARAQQRERRQAPQAPQWATGKILENFGSNPAPNLETTNERS
eukprot:2168644-Amphidinium_carterae.1